MSELRLPGDPHGIQEAHDVLAADEFAMPAHADAPHHAPEKRSGGAENPLVVLVAAALAAVLIAALRRR
jgi:hypothetical protein